MKAALRAMGKSGWLPAILTVLTIGLSECHRGLDSRKVAQESQDMLVRRMDLRFDWLKVSSQSAFWWMRNASPKLGVPPPMEMPEDAWPMEERFYTPSKPPGLYADELNHSGGN